jgi:hypothetical protein
MEMKKVALTPTNTRTLPDGREIAEYRFPNGMGANVFSATHHAGTSHTELVLIRETLPGREEHWSNCPWMPRGAVMIHAAEDLAQWLDRIKSQTKE